MKNFKSPIFALIVMCLLVANEFCSNNMLLAQPCQVTINPSSTTICRGDSVQLVASNNFCQLSDLPVNLQNGLAAWYPFCGNANDESGNGHHGIVLGATLTADRFGNPNSAYHFNGNGYIAVPNYPGLNVDSITIIAFVKPDPGSTKGIIVAKSDSSNATKFSYHLTHEATYANQTGFMCAWGDGNCIANSIISSQYLFGASGLFPGTSWSMAAMKVDNTGFCTMYKDNQIVSQGGGSTPMGQCNLSASTLRIGGPWWVGDPYYFEGSIDDIFIYNRPLSHTDIQQLYQLYMTQPGGSFLWSTGATTASNLVSPIQTTTYTVTQTTPSGSCNAQAVVNVISAALPISGPSTALAGQTQTFTAPFYNNLNYTWVVQNGSITGGQGTNTIQVQWGLFSSTGNVNLSVCNYSSNQTVSITSSQTPPTNTACLLAQLPTNLQNGLVAWYPFCGTANDESGNGNHGVVNGATLSIDRFGNPSNSYLFNGISDYIEVPNSSSLNVDSITIVAYVKPVPGTTKGIVVAKSDPSDATNFSYHLTHEATYLNNSGLMASWGLGNCSAPSVNNSGHLFGPSNLVTGISWDMIAMSVNGSGLCQIYHNAQPVSLFLSGQPMGQCNDPRSTLRIGGPWWVNDPYLFEGNIDDIYIYNRVLSSAEIVQLYNLPLSTQHPIVETPMPVFSVYPNPFSSGITLEVSPDLPVTAFRIINGEGKLLRQFEVQSKIVYVDSEAFGVNGLFLIQALNADGEILHHLKVVRE